MGLVPSCVPAVTLNFGQHQESRLFGPFLADPIFSACAEFSIHFLNQSDLSDLIELSQKSTGEKNRHNAEIFPQGRKSFSVKTK